MNTADRIRRILSDRPDVVEKPMIGGGLAFMIDGHMCCGASANGLTVRVGPEGKTKALAGRHVKPLVIGSRETAAFVLVEPDGYRTDEELRKWIEHGLRFVATLT